jgi:hypothetical protein
MDRRGWGLTCCVVEGFEGSDIEFGERGYRTWAWTVGAWGCEWAGSVWSLVCVPEFSCMSFRWWKDSPERLENGDKLIIRDTSMRLIYSPADGRLPLAWIESLPKEQQKNNLRQSRVQCDSSTSYAAKGPNDGVKHHLGLYFALRHSHWLVVNSLVSK